MEIVEPIVEVPGKLSAEVPDRVSLCYNVEVF